MNNNSKITNRENQIDINRINNNLGLEVNSMVLKDQMILKVTKTNPSRNAKVKVEVYRYNNMVIRDKLKTRTVTRIISHSNT